jgi:hypothetical protein
MVHREAYAVLEVLSDKRAVKTDCERLFRHPSLAERLNEFRSRLVTGRGEVARALNGSQRLLVPSPFAQPSDCVVERGIERATTHDPAHDGGEHPGGQVAARMSVCQSCDARSGLKGIDASRVELDREPDRCDAHYSAAAFAVVDRLFDGAELVAARGGQARGAWRAARMQRPLLPEPAVRPSTQKAVVTDTFLSG